MSAKTAFLEALEARRNGRATLALDSVMEAFHATFPAKTGRTEVRAEVRQLLDTLVADGIIVLPSTKTPWDRVREPALPLWVKWPPSSKGPSALQLARTHPWPPALEFVLGLKQLSSEELRFLHAVQSFLAAVTPQEPLMTVRERSLILTGDDKRLEQWVDGQLFGPGRLSTDLLRCQKVHPPLTVVDVGAGLDALIVENQDTFHSACRAARDVRSNHGVRWVVYGAGNAVLLAFPGVKEWAELPRRWWYFGDIDRRGLGIARQLATLVPRVLPGGVLMPAVPMYTRLLIRAEQLRLSLYGKGTGGPSVDALLEWLPAGLGARVRPALEEHRRLPQEAVPAAAMVDALVELASTATPI